jgi:hypothetical protein
VDDEDIEGEEDGGLVDVDGGDVTHSEDDQIEALDDLDGEGDNAEFDAIDDISTEDGEDETVVDDAFSDDTETSDTGSDDLEADFDVGDDSGSEEVADEAETSDGTELDSTDTDNPAGLSDDQVDEAANGIESFFGAVDRVAYMGFEDDEESVLDDPEVATTEIVENPTDPAPEENNIEVDSDPVDVGADTGSEETVIETDEIDVGGDETETTVTDEGGGEETIEETTIETEDELGAESFFDVFENY